MSEKIPDYVYEQNWKSLLKIFHNIDRFTEGAKEKLLSLIELAKTKHLHPRQMEGIVDRCKYQVRLIDNPEEKPFSNGERKEDRNSYQLSQSESNGKA